MWHTYPTNKPNQNGRYLVQINKLYYISIIGGNGEPHVTIADYNVNTDQWEPKLSNPALSLENSFTKEVVAWMSIPPP